MIATWLRTKILTVLLATEADDLDNNVTVQNALGSTKLGIEAIIVL